MTHQASLECLQRLNSCPTAFSAHARAFLEQSRADRRCFHDPLACCVRQEFTSPQAQILQPWDGARSRGLVSFADWIEHVIATDGDQYLKTPEHLLPWHVRSMLDIHLALALIASGLSWLAFLGLRRLCFGRRQKAHLQSKAAVPGKGEGVKTFHVVASTRQGEEI